VHVEPAELIVDSAHPSATTIRVGGADQSYVDLADPRRLEFDYVQRIADLLDVCAEPGRPMRVVHVGGGGLTLARYVAATRPRSSQIVLEPDAALTELVRRELPVPKRSGIRVRPVDGRTGLAAIADARADVLIVDAFVGARVPAELTTAEFLADASRVLGDTGMAIWNITDRGPSRYGRRVLAGVTEVFAHTLLSAEPSTLKGRRFGNLVLAGSAAPLPVTGYAERAARGAYPYRVLHGARLTQLIGGLRGFTDADAEPSPGPQTTLNLGRGS
jgi:hypothetical protein